MQALETDVRLATAEASDEGRKTSSCRHALRRHLFCPRNGHVFVPESDSTVSAAKVSPGSLRKAAVGALAGWAGCVGAGLAFDASVGGLVATAVPALGLGGVAWLASRTADAKAQQAMRATALGLYELEQKIGEGGMGEVWRGRHRLLRRPAALKLIKPKRGAVDEHARRRFEREAQATALLRSPHTVQLYDYGVTNDGTWYYVMELLDGLDLSELVAETGPLPAGRVVFLLRQVLDSLGEAHERELIHRDIKPSNLFVSHYGRQHDFMTVLDFGLVKRGPDKDETALSQDGTISGTPAYLAPEIATGERAVSAQTDLYALGCVAWFLLTGRPVFLGDNAVAVAVAHATQRPEPPSAHARDVPEELDALVLRCLAKEPAGRPANADALAEELDAIPATPWSERDARAWWTARASERQVAAAE